MLYSHRLCHLGNLFSKDAAKLIDLITEVFDFQKTLGEMIIGLLIGLSHKLLLLALSEASVGSLGRFSSLLSLKNPVGYLLIGGFTILLNQTG